MTDKEPQDQAETLLVSMKDLNNLVMENVQKLMKMNLDIVENYTQIGLDNYKAATGIKTVDELMKYAQKQRDIAQEVGKKISEDAKTVVDMSNQYVTTTQKVAEDNVPGFMPVTSWGMTMIRDNTDRLMSMFKPTHGTTPQVTSQSDKAPDDVQ